MSDLIKFQFSEFPDKGNRIKDDERYRLTDCNLGGLTVSMTELHVGQETKGHFHDDEDEVYQFISGVGRMQLGDDPDSAFPTASGMIVLVKAGDFHKLFNDGDTDLVCWCVFNGGRNH